MSAMLQNYAIITGRFRLHNDNFSNFGGLAFKKNIILEFRIFLAIVHCSKMKIFANFREESIHYKVSVIFLKMKSLPQHFDHFRKLQKCFITPP